MSTEAKPVRTRMKAPERREAILDAAGRSFARLGYRVATMADIAAEAGITQPMLYRHFPSKRDLYLEVMDRCMAQVNDIWRSAVSFEAMGQAYVALAVARPDSVRLRLQALAECEDEEIRARYQRIMAEQVQLVEAMAARELEAGRIVPGATPIGVAGLFVALGALVDISFASGMAGPGSAVAAGGALFWQLIRPQQNAAFD